MTPVLNVRGLTKAFSDGNARRVVLDGIDLEVAPGEVLGLTGPSGCGKSTLLNLLAGVLRADAGLIELDVGNGTVTYDALSDAELTRLRRRHIGYVFQFFNLVPTLTVRENVLLPLELNGRPEWRDEALGRLRELGLGARLDDFPAYLSGGERQRTAIARALAHRPRLVLADEPTGNLDAANGAEVMAALLSSCRQSASALVVATHSEAVATRADRLLQLEGA
jgi:putative ABC transport system ATP-binding protein